MFKSLIKPILPSTLFGRSLMILVTPVILIQIVSTVVFIDRHWDKMTERLAHAVAGEVVLLEQWAGEGIDSEHFKEIANAAGRHLDLVVHFEEGGQIRDSAGSAVDDVSTVKKTLAEALREQTDQPFDVQVDVPKKRVYVSLQMEQGTLNVSLPQRRLFSSSGYIFLLWMVGISIVLLLIAILFMRNQIRPIRRLAIAADRFGKGQPIPETFKPEGAREVRQAARAFLRMHDRIRKQIEQRTAMLAGVSHDLRTPLTRMKLQVSMLPDSEDLQALKADIDDMEKMINAYLDFMRGKGDEVSESVDIGEMITTVAVRTEQGHSGLDVKVSLAGRLLSRIRPIAFERCLGNILENAARFGTAVAIDAFLESDHIHIVIDDNGPGVAPEMADELFKPFVRGEPSRNKNTGGVGLGLTIARDVVHSHGGEIELLDSPMGGLRVRITIPA